MEYMRRGIHETKVKAEMQADETRDRAEMHSLCRHNMAVLSTKIAAIEPAARMERAPNI